MPVCAQKTDFKIRERGQHCVCRESALMAPKPAQFSLYFGQTGPVDPDFFGHKPSLDLYGSFEPKTNPLDHSIQKIRVLLDRMYSPFLFSFIVLEMCLKNSCCIALA